MGHTVSITIRTDVETKEAIKQACAGYGISINEAVNSFFSKVRKNSSILRPAKKRKYGKRFLEAIAEAEDIIKNPHLYKFYDSVEEMNADLDSYDEV